MSETIVEPKPETKPAASSSFLSNIFGTATKPTKEAPKEEVKPRKSRIIPVKHSTRKVAMKLRSMKHKIINVLNHTINDLVNVDCKQKRHTRKRKAPVSQEEEVPILQEEEVVEEEVPITEEKMEMVEPMTGGKKSKKSKTQKKSYF